MLDRSTTQGSHADDRLRQDPIIWLTTVNGAGQPQSSPVWFVWDGQSFLHYSRPGNQKIRNIVRNPRVSLHLNDNGIGGDIVTIEATAELAGDAPRADQHPDYVEKYRDGISRIGMDPAGFADAYSQPIRITPLRARIW